MSDEGTCTHDCMTGTGSCGIVDDDGPCCNIGFIGLVSAVGTTFVEANDDDIVCCCKGRTCAIAGSIGDMENQDLNVSCEGRSTCSAQTCNCPC